MAPTNPETWTHGPSIIKENELREVAALLGKGFWVHHPDAVGGISLSYNPNPQKYMVMQYHSVENGFRLPLHGLLRDLCLHFGFALGQLTANAHKYVVSYILRCCALDRTPKLDEFLLLFSIGGFPFYSLYPHNHYPIFEKSNPAMSSTGNQPQGDSTALAICKPVAALEAVPISAIPGLRRPIPSQKRPREGVTDDDFLPKKHRGDGTSVSPSPVSTSSGTQNTTSAAAPGGLELPRPESLDHEADELSDQVPLKKPAVQSQPDANNSLPQTASTPQELEIEVEEQEEPGSSSAAEVEIEIQKVSDAPSTSEKEAVEQNDAEVPPEMRRETETQQNQEEQREPEERRPATAPSAVSLPIRRKFMPQTYPVFTEGWASFSRVRKEKEFERRLCEGSDMMQKMLDDFQRERLEAEAKADKLVNDLCKAIELKRSLQSQDQMREINAQKEALEPKANPKPFNHQKEEEILPMAINDHILNCVEDTPLEEPVLEEIEPTTYPQDSNIQESKEESIDEEIPSTEEPITSIDNHASSGDLDQTFFDSLLDGCDFVCPKDSWSQKSWDELLVSDTEDSSMGESTVVIIKPQMDGQPVEDKKKINLAMKANDVDQLRRLPPPPTYLESPLFILLPPSRRDESRILDLDRATNQTRYLAQIAYNKEDKEARPRRQHAIPMTLRELSQAMFAFQDSVDSRLRSMETLLLTQQWQVEEILEYTREQGTKKAEHKEGIKFGLERASEKVKSTFRPKISEIGPRSRNSREAQRTKASRRPTWTLGQVGRLELDALAGLQTKEDTWQNLAQQSLLTLTEEYLGGASGNYQAVVLLKEKELAARALQQKEQIAAYQRGTQDLEAQFDRLRAQISTLESRASASEDKVGNLEDGLVEKESRISELENSLQEAKHESSRFNEFALKQMEARRLILEKLKEEKQTTSELRLRMDELEKTTAAHQEEVATLTARAEALYEEGKFDMQQCIYEAVQSGLPENRSLDDFISYYGLPLPLSPPASRADPGP
ncbi:unnamed protein product [Cuscuta campestris]|uniref:Uncharacterized protein n=1 Tax=Cuscuta campestris TaxID=132261 RepID=A0A484MCJ4_9ASTE|nr:unnamed protein product [Cuscuta campestris]